MTRRADARGAAGGRRRRALVVAYHFPPEGSVGTHRTLRLVRRLAEDGWDVTVLTGTPATYSAGCVLDGELLQQVPAEVRVIRAPALRPFDRAAAWFTRERSNGRSAAPAAAEAAAARQGHLPEGWRRQARRRLDGLTRIPDSHAGWLLPAVAAGLAVAVRHRPDVLYSTAPPWTGQLVAQALASATGVPWVADFRDPWARAPWREGWLPTARRAAAALERGVVRRADAVVFTTRTNRDEYARFYAAAAGKFHLVRNGCDRAEFAGAVPRARDGCFTMLHAGSLYGGRKPTALFAALAALRDRGSIRPGAFCFRQIGRVALTGFDMAAERRRLGLDGVVEILPSQPRQEILREMVSASCLLLLQPGTTVSIPGKLFEYFAAGRPILALAEEGETSELVRASSGGIAVLPEDQTAIERAILALLERRDTPGAPTSLALFDGALRTRELCDVLESACCGASRARRPAAAPTPGGAL